VTDAPTPWLLALETNCYYIQHSESFNLAFVDRILILYRQ